LARAIPPLLKNLNERTVLETIRAGAPISRAQISRRAGISKPTVSLALQSLLDAGLVRETAQEPGLPSYGAVYFEPVPDAALVLGFDIGTRFLRSAVCDLRGQILTRQDIELPEPGAAQALELIRTLLPSLLDATGRPRELVDSCVVGVPGVVDETTGRISLATNVPGLEERPFVRELQELVALPVTVDNDINLAALGERWQGIARGVDDFVFLSVGTGFGAGLVLGGELHRGHHGFAGEVDYALAGFGADVDPSGAAVASIAERLAAQDGGGTALVPPYEARAIFGAARAGDPLGRSVIAEIAHRIALHVAPIAAVADVALVVLGGGLGANGDLLLDPIRALLRDWLPYAPRVEVSALGEAAVLTGALAVGLRSALDNVFVNRGAASDARHSPATSRRRKTT
jgi:predicted NBD/HSP70 family sugar kinase